MDKLRLKGQAGIEERYNSIMVQRPLICMYHLLRLVRFGDLSPARDGISDRSTAIYHHPSRGESRRGWFKSSDASVTAMCNSLNQQELL